MGLSIDTMHSHAPGNDGLLRWMEAFASRVESAVYTIQPIIPEEPESMGLSLFPAKPTCAPRNGITDMSRAVTHGVEVCASALLVPEMGQWSYSIKIRLLPPGHPEYQSPEERGFTTCQVCTEGSRACVRACVSTL